MDKLVIGVTNAELSNEYEQLYNQCTEDLAEAIRILCDELGTKEFVLRVSEPGSEKALADAVAAHGLQMETDNDDVIDVRSYGDAEFRHPADILHQYVQKDAWWVVVDHQLTQVPMDATVSDVVTQDAKAAVINHVYYVPGEIGSTKIADLTEGYAEIYTIPPDHCIVEESLSEIEHLHAKCCGKCVYCREGLYQQKGVFTDLTLKKSKPADLDLAVEISDIMKDQTFCTLGQEAGRVAESTIQNFSEEVNSHFKKKGCPAGVCMAFKAYYVDPSKCKGCGTCIENCPNGAIDGKDGYISMINEMVCKRCGTCIKVCPNGAIQPMEGRKPKVPNRLTKVGRFRR